MSPKNLVRGGGGGGVGQCPPKCFIYLPKAKWRQSVCTVCRTNVTHCFIVRKIFSSACFFFFLLSLSIFSFAITNVIKVTHRERGLGSSYKTFLLFWFWWLPYSVLQLQSDICVCFFPPPHARFINFISHFKFKWTVQDYSDDNSPMTTRSTETDHPYQRAVSFYVDNFKEGGLFLQKKYTLSKRITHNTIMQTKSKLQKKPRNSPPQQTSPFSMSVHSETHPFLSDVLKASHERLRFIFIFHFFFTPFLWGTLRNERLNPERVFQS